MTPKRKAYWKKCSLKERTLRALINNEKCEIKVLKNNFKYPENYNFNILLIMIRQCKVRLSAYRHELHRLKGMDRVVVPKQTKHEVLPKTTNRPAIMSKPYFVCKCGDTVGFMIGNEWQKATYCTHCGRRILW